MNRLLAALLPRPTAGDALFEIDSNGFETDLPRTKLQISNFTAIQTQTSRDNEANDQAAGLFRGNSDTTIVNSVIIAMTLFVRARSLLPLAARRPPPSPRLFARRHAHEHDTTNEAHHVAQPR